MAEDRNCAPAAVFVYKRKDYAEKTLAALRDNFLAEQTELYIFSDQSDSDFCIWVPEIVHHFHPVTEVRGRAWKVQAFAYNTCKILLFHCQGSLIQIFHI